MYCGILPTALNLVKFVQCASYDFQGPHGPIFDSSSETLTLSLLKLAKKVPSQKR